MARRDVVTGIDGFGETVAKILGNQKEGFVLYVCIEGKGFHGAVRSSPQYPPPLRKQMLDLALLAVHQAHDSAQGGSPLRLEFSHTILEGQ